MHWWMGCWVTCGMLLCGFNVTTMVTLPDLSPVLLNISNHVSLHWMCEFEVIFFSHRISSYHEPVTALRVGRSTWPFFEAMHEAMGARDSIRPLSLISTAVDTEAEEDPDESPRHPSDDLPTCAILSTCTALRCSRGPPKYSTVHPPTLP